jgi:hypothetical protein
LVLSLSALGEPIGSMKQWLPATTGLAGATVPQSWLICDGSTVADASSAYNGIALPDARAKFGRGHNSLTNATFPSDNTYKAGGTIPTGGTDSNNLLHSHTYGFSVAGGGHTHSMQGHTHGGGSLVTDFQNQGNGSGTHTGGALGNPSIAIIQSNTFSPFDHNHAVTGGASGGPSIASTDNQGSFNIPINGSVNNSLGATENRPVFLEFVTIIKIK